MKINKVKLALEECINKIKATAESLDVEAVVDRKKSPVSVKLSSGDTEGLIRLYETKSKGITLDGSMKDRELNELVLNAFQNGFEGQHQIQIMTKYKKYNLEEDLFDEVKAAIKKFSSVSNYVVEEKEDVQEHIFYMLVVRHAEKNDRVTITQFNSGILSVQGKSWVVWDEVCNHLDEVIDVPVEEVIIRYIDPSASNKKIENIITDDLVSSAEKRIKKRMGDAYKYLYDHDKKLITSSQGMLDAQINYGDYYCYVAPAVRVIEGYLIKVILGLNLVTSTQMHAVNDKGKRTFNYGQIFNGVSNVQPNKKALLTDPSKHEPALLRIYDLYQSVRNPLQHNESDPPGPEMVSTYEDAESYFDEIVGTIVSTYNSLF